MHSRTCEHPRAFADQRHYTSYRLRSRPSMTVTLLVAAQWARPLSPTLRARSGLSRNSTKRSASLPSSPAGTNTPPARASSGIPPTGVLTNGRPALMASVSIIGIPSAREGSATTRAVLISSLIASDPRGALASSRSLFGTSTSLLGPTMTHRASGLFAATCSHAPTRTSAPFLRLISPANNTSSSVSSAYGESSSMLTGFGMSSTLALRTCLLISSATARSRHVITCALPRTPNASHGYCRAKGMNSAPCIVVTVRSPRNLAAARIAPSRTNDPFSER